VYGLTAYIIGFVGGLPKFLMAEGLRVGLTSSTANNWQNKTNIITEKLTIERTKNNNKK
jgi:hypothetical protein